MTRYLVRCAFLISLMLVSCQNTARNGNEPRLPRQKESAHFVFFSENRDANVIDDFIAQLEAGYVKIAEDIQFRPAGKVYVEIYPDIKALHDAIGIPDMPDWVAAYTGRRGDRTAIKVVSPNNPGNQHTGEFILTRVVVHELAQSMIFQKNGRRPPMWLFKGLASYEGNNLTPDEIRRVISDEVKAGNVPTPRDLQPAGDEKVPEGVFNDMNGYEYSYTIVDFIARQFGMEKIRELLDTEEYPYDYEAIFALTESGFYEAWVLFLLRNYTT